MIETVATHCGTDQTMLVTCLKCKKPVFVSSSVVAAGEAAIPCNACGAALMIAASGSVRLAAAVEESAAASPPPPPADEAVPVEPAVQAPAVEIRPPRMGQGSGGKPESFTGGHGAWSPAAPARRTTAVSPPPLPVEERATEETASAAPPQPPPPPSGDERTAPGFTLPAEPPASVEERTAPGWTLPAELPPPSGDERTAPGFTLPPAEPSTPSVVAAPPAPVPLIASGDAGATPAAAGAPASAVGVIETPFDVGPARAALPPPRPIAPPPLAPPLPSRPPVLRAEVAQLEPQPPRARGRPAYVAPFEVIEKNAARLQDPPAAATPPPAAAGAEPWTVGSGADALQGVGRHDRGQIPDGGRAGTTRLDEKAFAREARRGRRLPVLAASVVVLTGGVLWAAGVRLPGLPLPPWKAVGGTLPPSRAERREPPEATARPIAAVAPSPSPSPDSAAAVAAAAAQLDVEDTVGGAETAAAVEPDAGRDAIGKRPDLRKPKAAKGSAKPSPAPAGPPPAAKAVAPVAAAAVVVPQPSPLAPAPPGPAVAAPKASPSGSAADLYYQQGNLYLKEKKVALAIEEFKKCLAADPSYGVAYRSLGVAYMLLGREKSAIEAYEKFIAVSPGHRDAAKVQQIIADYNRRSGK
ncbi:MAG: hypothetical protein HY903_09050 [Deltaproteobacteria bacterium]|nr:hypothetical protein [Deltaproteobacteria bacterium]